MWRLENDVDTRAARLELILFSKDIGAFRSKVLVDFLHYVTQINCLTGETHITKIIFKLVGFGRACAPVRCAHPSFWTH